MVGEPPHEAWAPEVLGLLRGLPESTRETIVAMIRGAATVKPKPVTKAKPTKRRG
jgi:hypothetical protein